MAREVVIVGAARTPIGDFSGTLSGFSSIDLGVFALKGAMAKAGIKPEMIEEVVAGHCLQAAEPGNTARHVTIKSGIPVECVSMTVNQQCPSSMRATEVISQEIMLGKIDIGASVGYESMSNAPYLILNARSGIRMGNSTLHDSMLYNGLVDGFIKAHMGITAENVAEKYNITREEQDELSVLSHQRAAAAAQAGRFKEEMVPIEVKTKKGVVTFEHDEHVRASISMEALAKLPTVFKKGGTVTAGNASAVSDGGSALILMAADKAKELGVKPLARVVATASGAVEPAIMGMGVVPAVERVLKFANLKKEDIGYWELNEAFAAQFLGVNRELKLSMDIVNANGSGISLGHPVGCTGARIIVSLIYEMHRRGVKYGCASLCAGGGPAAAIIVEAI
ncbi:MAG: thiolase family protein [Firmicutes bacterium]|nr:thiolase family protein [Bacillota bacterium]